MVDTVAVTVGRFVVRVATHPSAAIEGYVAHAKMIEDFAADDPESDAGYVCLAIGEGDWPDLVVTLRFTPALGFDPGVLVVPDTGVVLIGAGTRLLGYRLDPTGTWRRLFVDTADFGFWGWRQHGDVVLMSAELELAAWTVEGEKLWSTFVEPPWSYQVGNRDVHLDVMGAVTTFDVRTGPPRTSSL